MTKQLDELLAEIVKPHAMELTPAAWLAMLPGVVAQLEPGQYEEFVTQILRACDRAGVELAGCVCDEFVVAKNWM